MLTVVFSYIYIHTRLQKGKPGGHKRTFFVRCGYGVNVRHIGFSTTVQVQPQRTSVERMTARTAPHRKENNSTAPDRTICDFETYENRTEPHRLMSKIKKRHRGAVL